MFNKDLIDKINKLYSIDAVKKSNFFRACSHKKSIKNHSQHDDREKNGIKFIIASKNFSETFDSEKITFYLISLFVKFFIIFPRIFTILLWRNNNIKPMFFG